MNGVPDEAAPGAGAAPASAETPAGSGEGADTALEALIRKRKLRADDSSAAPLPEDDLGLGPAP
jgi:hypothetical protein